MRVLCIIPNKGIHVLKFFDELERQGVEVAGLLDLSGELHLRKQGKWITEYYEIREESISGLPLRLKVFRSFSRFHLSYQAVITLLSAYRHFNADLIHVHWLWANYFEVFLSGKPYLMTAWGSDINVVYVRSRWKERVKLCLALFVADAVTGPTEYITRKLHMAGARRTKQIMFPGIDIGIFQENRDYNKDFIFLKKTSNDFLFFSPRAMQDFYNIKWIVKSFAKIKSPYAKLLLSDYNRGYEEYIDEIEGLIRDLKIESRVFFCKKAPLPYTEMAGLYALSDVVVSVPEHDALGSSCLEAMASQRPLIVSDIPAYQGTFMVDEVLRADLSKEDSLYECMQKLFDSFELRQTLAKNGLRRARQIGSLQENVRKFIELYHAYRES